MTQTIAQNTAAMNQTIAQNTATLNQLSADVDGFRATFLDVDNLHRRTLNAQLGFDKISIRSQSTEPLQRTTLSPNQNSLTCKGNN